VLKRARERGPGLCSELTTATARWRPQAVFWARGESVEAPARRPRAVEEVERDAWEASVSRRWPLAGPVRRSALHSGGERSSREVGRRWKNLDWFAISEISGT